MKNEKPPGLDSFSAEFFKFFGLLLLVDFEKALTFLALIKTFKVFNFGPNILSWLQLFNNNVIAYVNQCVFV